VTRRSRPLDLGTFWVNSLCHRSSPIHIHIHNPRKYPFPPTMTLLTPLSPPVPLPPCFNKMALEPPTYSPSATVPPYSVSPGPSERTLALSARSRRRTPTGVFTRSNKLIAIALRDQEQNAVQPSYGRNGTVCGDIGLSCTQGVQSVSIKVSFATRPCAELMSSVLGGGTIASGRPIWRTCRYFVRQHVISCWENRLQRCMPQHVPV
jgi:hypothetical protein